MSENIIDVMIAQCKKQSLETKEKIVKLLIERIYNPLVKIRESIGSLGERNYDIDKYSLRFWYNGIDQIVIEIKYYDDVEIKKRKKYIVKKVLKWITVKIESDDIRISNSRFQRVHLSEFLSMDYCDSPQLLDILIAFSKIDFFKLYEEDIEQTEIEEKRKLEILKEQLKKIEGKD